MLKQVSSCDSHRDNITWMARILWLLIAWIPVSLWAHSMTFIDGQARVHKDRMNLTLKIMPEDILQSADVRIIDNPILRTDLERGTVALGKILLDGFVMRDASGRQLTGTIVSVDSPMGPEPECRMEELLGKSFVYHLTYPLTEAPKSIGFEEKFDAAITGTPVIVQMTVYQEEGTNSVTIPVPRSPNIEPVTFDWKEEAPQMTVKEQGRWSTMKRYIIWGFEHILPKGLDHILFVLGLFFLGNRMRPLLWQVTAFTIAHSITLALSMYGVVRLSPAVVEPLIALSIAYVAIENICTTQLKPWRTFVVFGFGLLHGLGFAGVLTELHLPRHDFVTGLLCFNIGVELGQLAVIALAFVALGWSRNRPWYRRCVVIPASVLIAAAGLFWTVERILPHFQL